MEFAYGQGTYVEGAKNLEGQIILSEHKLYLKGSTGDLAQTYVPLEKIERLRKIKTGLEIHVRPSLHYRFCAIISGERKYISDLLKDLVQRRGLKKKFLKSEWVEIEY